MLLIITIVGTLVGTVLAAEASAWLPYVSRWLVSRSLAEFPDGIPDDVGGRWKEEIEGDLESYSDRPLGGFGFAWGVRRKGGKGLAAELALRTVTSADRPDEDASDEVPPVHGFSGNFAAELEKLADEIENVSSDHPDPGRDRRRMET